MLVTVEVNRCRELWWSCQVGLSAKGRRCQKLGWATGYAGDTGAEVVTLVVSWECGHRLVWLGRQHWVVELG
ncbi:hypothetical protein DOS86_02815 [Anaplasma marginale]|nr:hypothetical protein DOS86_02815 [Anaplasma marginale]